MEERVAVLVVDDDPLVLDTLGELLAFDYNVSRALSASDALRILAVRQFAVLVADQRMPGMTGVELAAKAREMQPYIVTILLSGYTDPQDMIAAINLVLARETSGGVCDLTVCGAVVIEEHLADALPLGKSSFH